MPAFGDPHSVVRVLQCKLHCKILKTMQITGEIKWLKIHI